MSDPITPYQDRAHSLLASLQEMAQHQTNPVLLMLGDAEVVEFEKHYPDPALRFGSDHWRAYYHCHAMPDQDQNEHGHFHLFTRLDGQWSHLAALAMDLYGQPLYWFCVNRWVTGGPWLKSDRLTELLCDKHDRENEPSVGRWLLAMLQVCTPQLQQLYQQRDRYCRSLVSGQPDEVFFENRDIYTLAKSPVNIQRTLEEALVSGNKSGSEDRTEQGTTNEPIDAQDTEEKSHA